MDGVPHHCELMNAAEIAAALNGKRNGDGFMARCPAHEDRTPSLSMTDRDGRTLVKCFAGCSQDAVIEALRGRGLWGSKFHAGVKLRPKLRTGPKLHPKTTARAKQIWAAGGPITNTLAERYLIARGITPPDPLSLRFHQALDYFDTAAPGSAVKLPTMIAAVRSVAGDLTAIQRVYLDPRGDRKAQVSTPKKTLGPVIGGAVRLAPVASTLALTEGVEDALALMQMTGRPTWAVLGTSSFMNFEPLTVTKTIVLAPDADPAGDNIASAAVERFAQLGLRVLHLRPPDGCDWCDVLDDFEERAAIQEIDGGEDRAEAELAAFAEVIGGGLADG